MVSGIVRLIILHCGEPVNRKDSQFKKLDVISFTQNEVIVGIAFKGNSTRKVFTIPIVSLTGKLSKNNNWYVEIHIDIQSINEPDIKKSISDCEM